MDLDLNMSMRQKDRPSIYFNNYVRFKVTKILHTEILKFQLFLLTIKQHMFCFLEKFTQLENFLHFYTAAGHDGRDKFQSCIVVLCLRSRKQKSLFACICQSDFEFSLTTKEINPALNTKKYILH